MHYLNSRIIYINSQNIVPVLFPHFLPRRVTILSLSRALLECAQIYNPYILSFKSHNCIAHIPAYFTENNSHNVAAVVLYIPL